MAQAITVSLSPIPLKRAGEGRSVIVTRRSVSLSGGGSEPLPEPAASRNRHLPRSRFLTQDQARMHRALRGTDRQPCNRSAPGTVARQPCRELGRYPHPERFRRDEPAVSAIALL